MKIDPTETEIFSTFVDNIKTDVEVRIVNRSPHFIYFFNCLPVRWDSVCICYKFDALWELGSDDV
jgi:hypothetical protein